MWLAIGGWFLKWVSGFALWKGDKLGKMLMYIVGGIIAFVLCGIVVWKLFFSPTLQNIDRKIQAAQTINNYTYNNLPNKKDRNKICLNILGVEIGLNL